MRRIRFRSGPYESSWSWRTCTCASRIPRDQPTECAHVCHVRSSQHVADTLHIRARHGPHDRQADHVFSGSMRDRHTLDGARNIRELGQRRSPIPSQNDVLLERTVHGAHSRFRAWESYGKVSVVPFVVVSGIDDPEILSVVQRGPVPLSDAPATRHLTGKVGE